MLSLLNSQLQKYMCTRFVLILVICLKSFNLWAQTTENNSLKQRIELLQANENYQKDTVYIDLLYALGKEISVYNLDSLSLLAKESIVLSQAINYVKGETQGLINMGSYYSEIGDHDKAINYFSKAISKAKSVSRTTELLKAKNLLAIEYEYTDKYALALREYLEGIEIAKESKDNSFLSTFYVNASNLYADQGDIEQCIHLLELAEENNKLVSDDYVKGLTLANLAASYIDISDLDTAEDYANESIAVFERIKLENWQIYAYELKASIYYEKNQPSLALEWFKKSEKIHESIEQTRYKIPLYNGLAKTYFKLKDFQTSEGYALRALEISKKINLLDQRDISLELLYKIKKETNDPKVALTYLEELKTLSDTLNVKKNEKELRILKSNLEFDQEKERYVLENEKKVNQQKSYFYAALLIILSALVIIIILKRNNTIQNRLNYALTIKSKELKNSNNTKSRLFSIIAHDIKGPINSFKSMFDMIKSQDMSSNDLINFVPKMSENINHVSFTLNNLLSWGQSQMDGIITKPEVVSIKSIVDENIALLSKSANQKLIKIESKIDNQILTWSDSNQIGIVIRNLISNALKFTPENGQISIGANDKNKFWEIWVKDTGVGLTEGSLEKILNKKESFSTYGTNNEKGTGLGLLLCKEMIENNNGILWAKSKLGVGTIFYFTLQKVSETN